MKRRLDGGLGTRWVWVGLALCGALGSCGRTLESTPLGLSGGGWFASCVTDDECGVGQCLCGSCTEHCDGAGECSASGATCVGSEHRAFDELCGGFGAQPICAPACGAGSRCPNGDDCVAGVCVPDVAGDPPPDVEPPPTGFCGDDGVLGGGVSVSQQADIDALEGCRSIQGDLDVWLFPGLDARPLAALEKVYGVLFVSGQNTQAGDAPPPPEPMPSFPRLAEVGGMRLTALDLRGADFAAGTHPFPMLRSIDSAVSSASGQLRLWNCRGMPDLTLFAGLQGVSDLALGENPELRSLRGLEQTGRVRSLNVFDNPRLASLRGLGGMEPSSANIFLNSNDVLVDLSGPVWPSNVGELSITGNASLVSLVGLDRLREVGTVTIRETGLMSLQGLSGLSSVSELDVTSNAALSSLAGLEALRAVEGTLRVQDNPSLTAIAGLTSLERAPVFLLTGNTSLSTLSGVGPASLDYMEIRSAALPNLAGLEQVRELRALELSDSPALTSLAGLAPLGVLESLSLTNTGVLDLDALAGLEDMLSLVLTDNPNLLQVDGLSNVTGLSSMIVSSNPSLERLPTFAAVRGLGGSPFSIQIIDNDALLTGPAFPSQEYADLIAINDNDSLGAVTGFDALSSVSALYVHRNSSVAALNFPNIANASSITITDNRSLNSNLLAPLREGANLGFRKIVSNQDGPTLFEPCPWASDGFCDEPFTCAPRSDESDCGVISPQLEPEW